MTTKPTRPTDPAAWEQRYVDGHLPWDSGRPDMHLPSVVDAWAIAPGPALEVGCGTGTNAVWLAQRGFEVTGLDVSTTAIERARARAGAASVPCRFLAADFLDDPLPGSSFGFVYDRGCFHVFDSPERRSRFAARVHELLAPGGLWHSLIGSTDGPPRETGPPRRSALDITTALEPHFEILELRSTTFDAESHRHARAWVLVARRRD